jgi:carboxymethylenebutenolidase
LSLQTAGLPVKSFRLAKRDRIGGQDQGIPPDKVNAFEAAVKSIGKPVDAKLYPQAGHASENPNNKMGGRADDATGALGRIDRFFTANLGN